MRSKSITHAHSPQPSIASSFNIDMGVADDCSLLRPHAIFLQQFARALWVRFLGVKTVSAIDLCEERAQPQRLNDGPRWNHRFVGEHRHRARSTVRATLNGGQRILDAIVNGS